LIGDYDEDSILECLPSWSEGPFTHFVLISAEQAVATVSVARIYHRQKDVGLSLVAVDPMHRGKGIGRELISHTIAYLRQEGIREVFVNAAYGAVEFYQKSGFSEKLWHPETLQNWGSESGPPPVQMSLLLNS
jgi:N-acetylglutamate synthase-like GNAT family acetyltransferase